MARNRTLNPDLWTDDKVVQLSVGAELLYIGCISQADDEGRLEWSARQLKGRLFGGRDDVTTATVESWMREITSVGLVSQYVVDAKSYGVHPQWEKHQYVNRKTKSKLPSPNGIRATQVSEPSHQAHGLFTEHSLSDNGAATESHVPSVSESVSDSDKPILTDGRAKKSDYTEDDLLAPVRAISKKPLGELSPDERRRVGRLALFRYSNTHKIDKVEKRAQVFAQAATSVFADDKWRDMTVSGFMTATKRAWESGGRRPLQQPWSAFKAEVVLQ